MAESSRWDRVVELARISMENPAAAAVLRLHYDEYGSCAECTGEAAVSWPCPTVEAIARVAARPKLIVIDPAEAVKQVQVPVGPWQWEWPPVVTADQLPGHPLVKPGEPS